MQLRRALRPDPKKDDAGARDSMASASPNSMRRRSRAASMIHTGNAGSAVPHGAGRGGGGLV
jgi:hypothetical protein